MGVGVFSEEIDDFNPLTADLAGEVAEEWVQGGHSQFFRCERSDEEQGKEEEPAAHGRNVHVDFSYASKLR